MSFSKALEAPHKLFKIYPYILFVGFFFFEIRMILLHMPVYPMKGQILLSAILLPFIILSLWKSFWLLFSLAVAVPLFSGMQAYGYWPHVQIPSLLFGIIFVFWMPKRILIQKKGLVPKSTTGFWIDIFSGIIFLSLLVSLSPFPLEVILYQFWFFPILSQTDTMYCIEAAFIILQGLFWFRMLELENPLGIVRGKLVLILFVHIWIILFFSMAQFLLHIPTPFHNIGLFSPFDDIHSYGSYVAFLFFISTGFFMAAKAERRNCIFFCASSALLLFFSFLSYSRMTWIAILIVSLGIILYSLPGKKKFILLSICLLFLTIINFHSNFILGSKNGFINRIGRTLIFKEMSDISRITFWERAGKMIIALPFTGNGIGSFFGTSLQYQNPERKEYYDDHENAHNYFLQIAAELGLPAVLIFMGILYHVFCSGLIHLREERNSWPMKGFLLGLSAYIFTWLTGHPLLIAKQQFLFWFMAFLIAFWPGGTSEDPPRVVPSLRFLIGLMVLLLVGYSIKMGPASKDLTYEVGFYPSGVVDGQEVRWIGKKAFVCTQQKGKFMSFDIYAFSQNIGAKGLKFQVWVNGQLWDDTCLTRDGKRKFQYYLPWTDSKLIKIMLQAGRTFNPARLGMNTDTRNLGVLVGKINFSDRLPLDGIGFYDSEIFPAE